MTVNRLSKLSEKLRALSGLFLIASFLVLGSCPIKKVVHFMIAGTQTGQTTSGSGKTLASAVCSSVDTLNKKLNLPARQSNVNAPFIFLLVLTGFITPFILSRATQNNSTYRGPTQKDTKAVPVYLRNRLLLI